MVCIKCNSMFDFEHIPSLALPYLICAFDLFGEFLVTNVYSVSIININSYSRSNSQFVNMRAGSLVYIL